MDVADFLDRWTLYLASLPLGVRVTIFVVAGLSLAALGVPRFQDEFFSAALYCALAVLFFWMAIAALM